MSQLHPNALWLFRFGAYITMILIPAIGLFIYSLINPNTAEYPLLSGSIVINKSFFQSFGVLPISVYFVIVVIVGEIYSRMSYNRWFYEFTDDGLKLERGIIWKRYSNVLYGRIQNVDVHRGIIARMFGFSSLMIQTAGYSAQPHAEGYIPAVEMSQAEQIRSFVMKKITGRKK